MAPSNSCAGCRKELPKKDYLCCHVCKLKYDLDCANIPRKRFVEMATRQRASFKCLTCSGKQPIIVGNTKASSTCMDSESSCRELSSHETSPESESMFIDGVTQRTKPTYQPPQPNKQDSFVTEERLRDILQQELSSALTVTIKRLVTSELNNLLEKITGFQDTITFLNQQFEVLKSSLEEKTSVIENLKKDNDILKSTITNLSNRLGSVELHMRENNILISGIPEHRSENLFETVLQIAKVIDTPLTQEDIQHVTRVAKVSNDSNRPRAVVAKLRSPRLRDVVLAAVSKFNKKNSNDKLNSHHIGIGGTKKPIFVAEHLTPENNTLYAAARAKAKEAHYKFVWIRNGRIFVRKNENCQALLIRNKRHFK
ncbi:unnamed protein product [Colias eurytheme]|nr:unnamed protein product [Colias eurytheme]